MFIITTPRRLFGVAGALIFSGLLLTPYDFAEVARTIAALTVTVLHALPV